MVGDANAAEEKDVEVLEEEGEELTDEQLEEVSAYTKAMRDEKEARNSLVAWQRIRKHKMIAIERELIPSVKRKVEEGGLPGNVLTFYENELTIFQAEYQRLKDLFLQTYRARNAIEDDALDLQTAPARNVRPRVDRAQEVREEALLLSKQQKMRRRWLRLQVLLGHEILEKLKHPLLTDDIKGWVQSYVWDHNYELSQVPQAFLCSLRDVFNASEPVAPARPETPLHSLGASVEDAEPQVLIEALLRKDAHFKFLDDLLNKAQQEAVDTGKPQAMLMPQEGRIVYPVPASAFQWEVRDLVDVLTKKAPQNYQLFERGQQAFNDARNSGSDQYLRITPSGATVRVQASQPQPQPQPQQQARSQQEHQQRQNRAQEMLQDQFQSVHRSLANSGIANPSGYKYTAAAGMTVVSGVDLVAKIIEVPTAEESAAASAVVVPSNVVPRRMGPRPYENTDFDPNLPGGVYENAWMLKPASERLSQAHNRQKQDQSPIYTWYKLYLIAYRAAYLCFYPPGAIPQTFVTITVPYGNGESFSVVIRMPPNRKPGDKFFLVPTTVKVPSGAVPGKWCLVPDLNGATQPVLLPRYARPSDYVHSMVPRTFDEAQTLDVRFGGGHAQPPSLAERDIVSQTTFKTTLEVPAACREGDHVIFTLMNDDAQDLENIVTIPPGGKSGVLIAVTIALPGNISTSGLSVVRAWKMGNRPPSLSSRRRRAAPAPVPGSSSTADAGNPLDIAPADAPTATPLAAQVRVLTQVRGQTRHS